MNPSRVFGAIAAAALAVASGTALVGQQRGRGDNPFPGGTNPDGSLRPTPPVSRLFTQDAYTQYEILGPGSESFAIRFLPEETRVGATELVNGTRGGSEGSGVEEYDPRTGKPLKFMYAQEGNDPENHAIHAQLPRPVPEGGIGRVLILKTYKDPRTYMMHGDDIVWVRSLSGYRPGVLLPKGFAFISSTCRSAHDDADGRLSSRSRTRAAEQPGDDPCEEDIRGVSAAEVHRHVLRRREDAVRPRRALVGAHRRGADLQ